MEEKNEKRNRPFAVILFALAFAVTLAFPIYSALYRGCIPFDSLGTSLTLGILIIFVLSLIVGNVAKLRFKKENKDISKKALGKFNFKMDSVFFLAIVLYFIGLVLNIYILLLIICAFFFMGMFILKKEDHDIAIRGLARINRRLSLFFGIAFVILFFSIPSGEWYRSDSNRKIYVLNIKMIGKRIERYVENEHKYPKDFKELKGEYSIGNIPDLEKIFIYKIETIDGKEQFTIEHPEPEVFLMKESRLSCPVRCARIRYVEGKGIEIVKNEK